MTPTSPNEVTQLLLAWSDGDQTALEELTPLVYAELRRLAEKYMRHERAGHPLQTTALVNEAYLRLIDLKQAQWPQPRALLRHRCPGNEAHPGGFRPQAPPGRARRVCAANPAGGSCGGVEGANRGLRRPG